MEQGFICCYCMCRIAFENMRVEHYIPRLDKTKIFTYTNLLGACEGTCAEDKNCDNKKGNMSIAIDPCSKVQNCESIINYHSKDASITCIEPYFTDIDKTLNLNDSRIKRNRKNVLDGAIEGLNYLHRAKQIKWTKPNINAVITKYCERDVDGRFKEYCQIVVYYLNKKLLS